MECFSTNKERREKKNNRLKKEQKAGKKNIVHTGKKT